MSDQVSEWVHSSDDGRMEVVMFDSARADVLVRIRGEWQPTGERLLHALAGIRAGAA